MKHIISKDKHVEMDRDIVVTHKYPEIQFDMFEYQNPYISTGPDPERIGIMGSTIFNDKLIYQYCVLDTDKMVNGLGDKIYVSGVISDFVHNSVKGSVLSTMAGLKTIGIKFKLK